MIAMRRIPEEKREMIAGSRMRRLSPSFVLAVFLGAAMLLVVLAYAREVE